MLSSYYDSRTLKQIALAVNKKRMDLSGLPHETLAEAVKRGVKITKCESHFTDYPTRAAFPKSPRSWYTNNIYDWRV